jgi:hypothetical protein
VNGKTVIKRNKYMAKPIEKSIQDERDVDKDTARSRDNVEVTQGFSKEVVLEHSMDYTYSKLDRYRTKPNEEGIRHGRGVDKDTVENRYNVDLTQGDSKDAVR